MRRRDRCGTSTANWEDASARPANGRCNTVPVWLWPLCDPLPVPQPLTHPCDDKVDAPQLDQVGQDVGARPQHHGVEGHPFLALDDIVLPTVQPPPVGGGDGRGEVHTRHGSSHTSCRGVTHEVQAAIRPTHLQPTDTHTPLVPADTHLRRSMSQVSNLPVQWITPTTTPTSTGAMIQRRSGCWCRRQGPSNRQASKQASK